LSFGFLGFRFFFNGGLESGGGGNILLFIKLFIPANAGSVCNKFTSSGLVVGGTPLHDSTAEKIINPYTGLLEPMEHSDVNPTKN
jgi:hypothetical protein